MKDGLNVEIELGKILVDNDEAKEVIKQVQAAFRELSEASLEAIDAAKKANQNANEYHEQLVKVNKANLDLTQAIKNIHIVLGSKRDLWENDKEIEAVMNSLATFVLGSGSMKAGIIAEGMNDEKHV